MNYNKSRTYLLYYIDKYLTPIRFKKQLLNTYLFYADQGLCIGLLYDFLGTKEFTKYEQEHFFQNPYFIDTHNHDPKGDSVIYLFNVPDELVPTLNLFLDGKYSHLPERDLLINYVTNFFEISDNHPLIHIIRKSDEYRELLEEELNVKIPHDIDLTDKPSIDKETYRLIHTTANYGSEPIEKEQEKF